MCVLRPILNLAWNNITNGVYMLANCSECCVMLSRAHYLAIYETLSSIEQMIEMRPTIFKKRYVSCVYGEWRDAKYIYIYTLECIDLFIRN